MDSKSVCYFSFLMLASIIGFLIPIPFGGFVLSTLCCVIFFNNIGVIKSLSVYSIVFIMYYWQAFPLFYEAIKCEVSFLGFVTPRFYEVMSNQLNFYILFVFVVIGLLVFFLFSGMLLVKMFRIRKRIFCKFGY